MRERESEGWAPPEEMLSKLKLHRPTEPRFSKQQPAPQHISLTTKPGPSRAQHTQKWAISPPHTHTHTQAHTHTHTHTHTPTHPPRTPHTPPHTHTLYTHPRKHMHTRTHADTHTD